MYRSSFTSLPPTPTQYTHLRGGGKYIAMNKIRNGKKEVQEIAPLRPKKARNNDEDDDDDGDDRLDGEHIRLYVELLLLDMMAWDDKNKAKKRLV